MNLRNLTLTVAALVAACGVAWYLQRPATPASADPRVGQPVLAGDTATAAARLTLSDQGKTVELARGADGAWTVPSYHDFPADFAKLSRLITDLSDAKVQRLVTSRADRLARLEFKDTSLRLAAADGRELWHVTLGKTAEGGGRFLRFGTEEKGYQAALNVWLDAEPKNWADATLLNLKPDDVAAIELGFADGATVAATRAKKEDPWTAPAAPAGKRIKVSTLTTVLSNLGSLRFSDTTAPDDEKAVAARPHGRTVKLTTFDGKSYTVTLARVPEVKKPKAPTAAPIASSGEPSSGQAAPAPAPAPADTTAAPVTPAGGPSSSEAAAAPTATPPAPEFETIPAGPVFVSIAVSDEKATVNALMQKRAFQIGEWTYTSLPAAAADLWEDAPVAAPAPAEAPAVPAGTTAPTDGGKAPPPPTESPKP